MDILTINCIAMKVPSVILTFTAKEFSQLFINVTRTFIIHYENLTMSF